MAISNYSELKQSVIAWSKRGDLDLLIDDFILIAEDAMLANPQVNLRIRDQGTRSTATIDADARFIALPDDFLSMRKVSLIIDDGSNSRYPIDFKTPEQLHVLDDSTGQPTEFTVTSQIEFNIAADQAYTIEIQYMAGFTPLTSSNTTNIVLDSGPNVYLFGCLWAAMRYAEDAEEEARYLPLFIDAITGANRKMNEGRYGPRPRIIPRGTKP